MKKIIFVLMTAILANSCGIYKNYERPSVKTDGLYRDSVAKNDSLSSSDTISLADLSWRELFTDTTLQSLIQEGLTMNTDLRIAHLRVEQAQASLQSARLAYLPSVSLNPQGSFSSYDLRTPSKNYQLSGSASWEIDIFGKLTTAKRGAKAALEQSEAYRQAVQTQLIATISNSYYMLLMLDSQLLISEQTAANWKENVKIMRALKEAGQASEAAVAQTEANSLSVEASLYALKKQINETENSLSTLLGKTAQYLARTKLAEQSFPEQLSTGVPLQLLSRRPDIKQAEFALAEAFYSTAQARTAFYPSITLGGTAGWVNTLGNAIVNPGSLLLQAVGSLTQPLFNKGLNTARLKIAKAQQEEVSLIFQQSLLNAGAEVNNALVQWQTARARIAIDKKQIGFLQSAVNSTQLLMKHGSITYLEVLTAQDALLKAELTHISDRFDEIQGVINLYHALGGGNENSIRKVGINLENEN